MTREQEIKDAALDFELNKFDGDEPRSIFEAGAKWADEHPKSPWTEISYVDCKKGGKLYNKVVHGQQYICSFLDHVNFYIALKQPDQLYFMSFKGSIIPAEVFEYIMDEPTPPKDDTNQK